MKKTFIIALLAMFTVASQAQIVSSRSSRITTQHKEHTPKLFLDLGAGIFTGDVDDTGIGVDLGLRYNHMFTENFGWDILKVSAQADTKHFSETLNVQAKTGLRGVTPVLFGNSTLYINAAGGYGYYTDLEEGGFVWEVGAGINFTPRVSLGIAYNNASLSYEDDHYYDKYKVDQKIGLITLRLSYGF